MHTLVFSGTPWHGWSITPVYRITLPHYDEGPNLR